MAILITIPSFAEEAGSGALFEEADEAARQPAGARSWFDPSLGLQIEDCAQRTLKQRERAMYYQARRVGRPRYHSDLRWL